MFPILSLYNTYHYTTNKRVIARTINDVTRSHESIVYLHFVLYDKHVARCARHMHPNFGENVMTLETSELARNALIKP